MKHWKQDDLSWYNTFFFRCDRKGKCFSKINPLQITYIETVRKKLQNEPPKTKHGCRFCAWGSRLFMIGIRICIPVEAHFGKQYYFKAIWKYAAVIHGPVWRILTAINNNNLFLNFGRSYFHARDELHIRKEFLL